MLILTLCLVSKMLNKISSSSRSPAFCSVWKYAGTISFCNNFYWLVVQTSPWVPINVACAVCFIKMDTCFFVTADSWWEKLQLCAPEPTNSMCSACQLTWHPISIHNLFKQQGSVTFAMLDAKENPWREGCVGLRQKWAAAFIWLFLEFK